MSHKLELAKHIFSIGLRWLRAQILMYSHIHSGPVRGAALPNRKSVFIQFKLRSGLGSKKKSLLPKNTSTRKSVALAKNQNGFLMPVAAFIVVVMGILALALVRMTSSNAMGNAQEMISVQTFYAAESGAQYAMNQLFYNTAAEVTTTYADAQCTAINGDVLTFTAAGMNGCQATLACSASTDAGTGTSFYQISSDAQCTIGDIDAQRIVDVSAYLQ